MTTGKTIALTILAFVGKLMSLLFNMLSRFVIAFLPRSKHLLILWLQSPSPLILEPKNMKSDSFHFFLIYLPWSDKTWGYDLHFLNVDFKPAFSLSSFTFIKRLFSSSSLSAIKVVSSVYLRLLIFLLAIWSQLVSHPTQHFIWCTLHMRRYFANKGLSNQGDGFSSSHVWMWELDYKASWAPKNLCFWTVMLEKTLESPLDCKEIQTVHPKGNQSWVFIGRTDVEAETPILWSPDVKSWLIYRDPNAGKDWRREEKEMTEDEMVGWHHRLNGHEFE